MAWNGIGIGWPNASAYSTPPTERYLISDCVGYSGNFISNDYPIGEFIEGDRVTFTFGEDAFGKVSNVSTNPSDGVDIYATGVNSPNCYDNVVTIGYDIEVINGRVNFNFNCTAANNFNSDGLLYAISLYYYIDIYVLYNDGDDEANETLEGTLGPIDYNILGGDSFNLGTVLSDNYPDFDSYQIEVMNLQPSFYHTTGYNNGNNCITNFMRDSNYTIYANFQNDDC